MKDAPWGNLVRKPREQREKDHGSSERRTRDLNGAMTHSDDLAHWACPQMQLHDRVRKEGCVLQACSRLSGKCLEPACLSCHMNSLAPSTSHSQCPALGRSGPYVQDISPFRIASLSLFQLVP